MRLLVGNAGSSSLKLRVLDAGDATVAQRALEWPPDAPAAARKYRVDRVLILPIYRLVQRLRRRVGNEAVALRSPSPNSGSMAEAHERAIWIPKPLKGAVGHRLTRVEDVPLAVELRDGDPVSELSQSGEAATSGAAVVMGM